MASLIHVRSRQRTYFSFLMPPPPPPPKFFNKRFEFLLYKNYSVQSKTVTPLDFVSCRTFCSEHAVTSYYSKHAQENVI